VCVELMVVCCAVRSSRKLLLEEGTSTKAAEGQEDHLWLIDNRLGTCRRQYTNSAWWGVQCWTICVSQLNFKHIFGNSQMLLFYIEECIYIIKCRIW